MKILTMPQGGAEWALCRMGRPTASQADKLITPAQLKPSKSAAGYRNLLLAEWLIGAPLDNARSAYMDRGTEMEAEARAAYELEFDAEVRQVGFLLSDDGRFGGSPDGLVDPDGILELKCPSLHVHVGYMLDPASLEAEYRGQCQALLHVSGRQWVDLMAYNPMLPPVIRRLERDEAWQAAFATALNVFLNDLDACREKLAPYRSEIALGELPPELAEVAA